MRSKGRETPFRSFVMIKYNFEHIVKELLHYFYKTICVYFVEISKFTRLTQ